MSKIYKIYFILLSTVISINTLEAQCFTCKDTLPGTIFCDDFESDIPLDQKYFEVNNNGGDFIRLATTGRDGSYGMRVKWQAGEVGAGGLSKSFGKTPDSYVGKNAAEPTKNFDEIYWRMDVKMQSGWIGGGPDKLTRALCLANSNWAEGLMAHLWSGGPGGTYLGMDPASGIALDGTLKSTKYNDFPNLRWLGFKYGNIDMFSTANSGKWYCVVGHVKLNTPGKQDGIFEFWINDTLQASSTNLDWHSTWNNNPDNLHINAIFFENYWNNGSPVEQERYFDNIVISTQAIPCDCKTTSLISPPLKIDIQVYPNPANDKLYINSNSKIHNNSYSIRNLFGSFVVSGTLIKESDGIEISQLSDGMYLLIIDGLGIKFVKGKK
jgi:hypothetical protein